MLNQEHKEFITKDFQNQFLKYHFHAFYENLNFKDVTSNTITRVKNVIFDALELNQGLYYSEFQNISKSIHIYCDLINKAIEKNDICFVEDHSKNLLCMIGIPDKTKNPFVLANNVKEVSINLQNKQDLLSLQKSFFKGFTPILFGNQIDDDYLEILHSLRLMNCLSSPLLSLTAKNLPKEYSDVNFYNLYAFTGMKNNSEIHKLLHSAFNRANYHLVKNYQIKDSFSNYVHGLYRFSFFGSIDLQKTTLADNNKGNFILEKFFLNFTKENLNNILLTSHINKLTSFFGYLPPKFKNRYCSMLNDVLDNNIPIDNKVDPKDFKIALFLFNNNLEHKDFSTKFITKYSKFTSIQLAEILESIGLNKTDIRTFQKKFAALSFDNQNNEYVFNSIKETNIYGVSLDRKDFMLPIKDLTWTDTKNMLHNIKNPDFFFHFNDDSITLGLYSNYNFEFNRNDFVKVIIDTILTLKTNFENTDENKNKTYIEYTRIPLSEIREEFSKTIRSFMLNSVTKTVKEFTPSIAKKKI